MGLKKDLKLISEYADNPFDKDYRPEKETRRLYIVLLILLAIGVGACHGFGILIVGPICIYPIIMLLKCKACWKELKWKMIWFWIPLIFALIVGVILFANNWVFGAINAFMGLLGFKN